MDLILFSIIFLFLVVFYKSLILVLLAVPIRIVSQCRRRNNGHLRGERFLCCFDDQVLYLVKNIPSNHIRVFYLKYIFLTDIGKNVVIYRGCEIRSPLFLKIGEGSIIGDKAILDARAGLTIGRNVNLSSNVSIWTMQHDYRSPDFSCTSDHYGPVVIKDRSWLGPNSIILHDVTVGEGGVVAAGAVVTKSVDDFTVVGGIPARKIADRPRNLTYVFNGKHRLFI